MPFQITITDSGVKYVVDEDAVEQIINDINNGCGK